MSSLLRQVSNLLLWIGATLLLVPLSGCGGKRENVSRAFYEWRSQVSWSPTDLDALDSLNVTRLYIRFFDVQWSDEQNRPYPESVVRIYSPFPHNVEIIPTIYVTNEVMKQVHEDAVIEELARNMKRKIDGIANQAGDTAFKEVQIDCDWTASSRLSYFELLRQIKKNFPGKTISATIRLHQIKYRVETGIPPVDRGMLMAYNVGDVVSPQETNSIFKADEVDKYLGNLDDYPLPLDAALPVFSWSVRFHFDRFAALIDNVTAQDMNGRKEFKRIGENRWQVLEETKLRGESLYAGDILRVEEPNREEVLKIARTISGDIDGDSISVALYRFDPEIIERHFFQDFQAIFQAFE